MPDNLKEHETRVINERNELANKLRKLLSFIETSPAFSNLPAEEQKLLKEQADAMIVYGDVLRRRINLFN